MLIVIIILSALGVSLGLLLGVAARYFKVEEDPLIETVEQMLPGANCGQCGFPGCAGAAAALVDGQAKASCCPPGGRALAEQLAEFLNLPLEEGEASPELIIAHINAEQCTGCTRCYRQCPTDAIVGANGQIHRVIFDACTGCGKCQNACPEENCVSLDQLGVSLETWHWPKPSAV
jgi:electron transport complex protein RnfB